MSTDYKDYTGILDNTGSFTMILVLCFCSFRTKIQIEREDCHFIMLRKSKDP